MTQTIDAPDSTAAAAAGAAVSHDLPCYRCGYNVRGLAGGGHCPECGAPIDESVRRHAADVAGRPLPLSESDPRWLRRLAWGCGLVFLGAVGTVGAQVTSLVDFPMPQPLRAAVFFGTFVIPACAAWMAAGREPVYAGRRRAWLRVVIRVSVVCWVVAMVAAIATLQTGSWQYLRRLFLAGGTAAAVLSWSFFWNLRYVAARFEARWPRHACTTLAFLNAIACLATFIPGLGEIETDVASIQMLASQPIVAHPSLLLLVPYSLTNVPRFDPAVTAQALMALISLASLAALATFHVALRRAAKRSAHAHHPTNAPVPSVSSPRESA